MIGALVYSMKQKIPLEDLIKLSMTAASGAVMTEGTKPPTKELVDQLNEKVNLETI